MILQETRSPSTSTLTGEQQEFRIATNSKAFRILVDGIYSDKIGAIVRELMSNAFDAHVRRGNSDVPFEVRLPNALNPTFSVRDFGCSMDHYFVMRSYSTLFESSKSESNDEVGAFGLGAKSFLAYTDACTLRCWMDGEERSYAIALNDSGVPEVRLVYRGASSEPQGTEVTFAVAHSDFTAFTKAASQCSYGFDVLPIFHGSDVEPRTPQFSGNGWRFYSSYVGTGDRVMIRQGCAIYPASVYVRIPAGTCMIVDTPIGSVNVTASREALALTYEQEKALTETVQDAVRGLNEAVERIYHALPSEIEKARFADTNKALMSVTEEWPVGVKIDPPVLRWDAGAMSNVTYVSARVANSMLVIHDTGVSIPRRLLRLRALGKRGLVVVETDEARINEIVRLLDLRADQVKKMVDIPDVAVVRKPSAARARAAKPEVMDLVWAYRRYSKAWAGEFMWQTSPKDPIGVASLAIERSRGVGCWATEVVRRLNDGQPLLLLSETEAKSALAKGQISPSKRLDVVLMAEALRESSRVRSGVLHHEFRMDVHNRLALREILRRENAAGVEIAPIDDTLRSAFALLRPSEYETFCTEARQKIEGFARRYPLLFGGGEQSISDYIEMCDRQTSSEAEV